MQKEKPNIIFLNISWMNKYNGIKNGDKYKGNFGYYKNNPEAIPHEIYNFTISSDNNCYGYAAASPNIHKHFKAIKDSEYVDNILVIWTATDPNKGSKYIVGWYKNARLFEKNQSLYKKKRIERAIKNNNDALFIAESESNNCILLQRDERTFKLNYKCQYPAYYGKEDLNKKVFKYIKSYKKDNRSAPSRNENNDPAWNSKVEKRAVEITCSHYERLGYKIRSVEQDNVGWDLEATNNEKKLLIEVKGLSKGKLEVSLTPNEYEKSKKEKNYILCVVTQALSDNNKLHCFSKDSKNIWVDDDDNYLDLKEKIAAILKLGE